MVCYTGDGPERPGQPVEDAGDPGCFVWPLVAASPTPDTVRRRPTRRSGEVSAAHSDGATGPRSLMPVVDTSC